MPPETYRKTVLNILYVCHRFPYPPKRGGKIRPFNMIRHMGEQGHQVTVASLARSAEEAEEGQGLAEHCHRFIQETVSAPIQNLRMVLRLPTTVPSSMGYFYSAALHRRIREAMAETSFDLIFVHCSSVAQYVSDVTDIPKILDYGDMDSQKWLIYAKTRAFPLSIGYWIEGNKMLREEKRLAPLFDLCTCTTRAELDTLQSYQTAKDTDWFPNGVDSSAFSLAEQPYEPDTICFIGRMDYYPNQQCMFEFCDQVMPLIQAKRPSVTLTIIGANPPANIRALGDRAGIIVTGSVPEVQPYVHKAAVNVAPLSIARGTQNKILESMALGVPVVSSLEAAGGVDAVAGEHLLTADSPQQYCDAIIGLLENPAERERLSLAGRERVLSNHNWAQSMIRMDAIIERVVQRRIENKS